MGEFVVEVNDQGAWRLMVNAKNNDEPFTFGSIQEAWNEIKKYYGEDYKHYFRVREK